MNLPKGKLVAVYGTHGPRHGFDLQALLAPVAATTGGHHDLPEMQVALVEPSEGTEEAEAVDRGPADAVNVRTGPLTTPPVLGGRYGCS